LSFSYAYKLLKHTIPSLLSFISKKKKKIRPSSNILMSELVFHNQVLDLHILFFFCPAVLILLLQMFPDIFRGLFCHLSEFPVPSLHLKTTFTEHLLCVSQCSETREKSNVVKVPTLTELAMGRDRQNKVHK
jgi:hypothetical protein